MIEQVVITIVKNGVPVEIVYNVNERDTHGLRCRLVGISPSIMKSLLDEIDATGDA